MPQTHDGKVAVVTGAATGIGQAFVRGLASRGAHVIIADVAPGDETLAAVRAAAPDRQAVYVRTDVSDPEQVGALRAAADDLGGADILVHNAGIYPFTPFDEMTFEEWRRVMSVNLDALFHLTKAFLPSMREQGWGRIVAMSSNTVQLGVSEVAHYVASKAGAIGFVRSLSKEVGRDGITVNAIAPSLTRTTGTLSGRQQELGLFDLAVEAQAIKRVEEPDDLVGALCFLTSDDAAFVTGQTLLVDGGWTHV
jgi:NAD(P)-dependent dehydrogenase (short-subunit alcohol dehydrogenase family)